MMSSDKDGRLQKSFLSARSCVGINDTARGDNVFTNRLSGNSAAARE